MIGWVDSESNQYILNEILTGKKIILIKMCFWYFSSGFTFQKENASDNFGKTKWNGM